MAKQNLSPYPLYNKVKKQPFEVVFLLKELNLKTKFAPQI